MPVRRPSTDLETCSYPRHGARRLVAALACVCLLGSTVSLPAHASLVGTEQVLHADGTARAHIHAWLAREDVRRELLSNGVDVAQVNARVDALTDAEAADFAGRIDRAPAGGDVLGILFAIFVILLITDILGLTKVFPFTRPIR